MLFATLLFQSNSNVGEGEQGVEKGGEPAVVPPGATAAAGTVKKKQSCSCTRSKENNQGRAQRVLCVMCGTDVRVHDKGEGVVL